ETRTLRAPPAGVTLLSRDGHELRCSVDGLQRRLVAIDDGRTLYLAIDGAVFAFAERSPYPRLDSAADPARSRAPVAGIVAQVLVTPGDQVVAGQPLVCVEAMKMEMWLNAGVAGRVRAVHAAAKDSVAAGTLLVELEIDS
ncbi:MAG: acetyl-CoA carboxylase biotin carboxyl carrier protein subunit, partial [Burkholderiales bacterium]|nr:acetyl-CoA carboxylase biotin carboxyl carrier protein subunit [Burkholderiales bacterium]